jgi:nitrite reductase (NADH) small subunit
MTAEKKWVRVTQCENIPLREGRSIRIESREIAIFRLTDRFLAIENRCPHKGGPLAEGMVSGNMVVCPLHAWKIDLGTGRVMNEASERSCLPTYPVRVCEGVIQIELPAGQAGGSEHTPRCFATSRTSRNPVSSVGEARV